MWRPSECLWCPISLILAEYDVLQRTSVTTSAKSTTFTAQTLHGRHALMSEKLSIGKKNHGSCVNNEVGTASSMRPSAAWDIWDKVWRAKKDCLCSVYLVLLSEAVAPLLFRLKYSGARWCHPNVSFIQRKHSLLGVDLQVPGRAGGGGLRRKRTCL